MNITGMVHVNINCRDFERSRAFYEELGFKVLIEVVVFYRNKVENPQSVH